MQPNRKDLTINLSTMHSRFYVRQNFWAALSFITISFSACNATDSQRAAKVEDTPLITDSVPAKSEPEKPAIDVEDSLFLVKDSVKIVAKHADTTTKDTAVLYTDSISPRYVYLTFDDGPLIGSQAIDSITTAKQVKTNVFLIGMHAEMSKRMYKYYQKYMTNPLIDSYNHSFTHAHNKFSVFYSQPQKAFADFDKNETALQLQHKIVRLPGRNIWYFDARRRVDLESGASTADLLHMNGYKIMGWDVEWKMNGTTGKPLETVSQIYRRMRNRLNNGTTFSKNNVVLLMHDDMFQNRKGQKLLSDLIDSLKLHPNYKFEHLRAYPKN